MNLPEELLECLHIKKVKMCVELNSFQDKMKAYLVIIPIKEKKEQKYKTNLIPIISYEVRYIRHKDIYTESEWGFDYDQVLADETTRIKCYFVLRTENNLELVKCLSHYSFDITGFKSLLPYENFDSALVHGFYEGYIDNEKTFPHLFNEDYVTN